MSCDAQVKAWGQLAALLQKGRCPSIRGVWVHGVKLGIAVSLLSPELWEAP